MTIWVHFPASTGTVSVVPDGQQDWRIQQELKSHPAEIWLNVNWAQTKLWKVTCSKKTKCQPSALFGTICTFLSKVDAGSKSTSILGNYSEWMLYLICKVFYSALSTIMERAGAFTHEGLLSIYALAGSTLIQINVYTPQWNALEMVIAVLLLSLCQINKR